jgi:NitT/TauT family transport system substrate-binding protein
MLRVMKGWRLLAAVMVVALALFVAACGDDDEPTAGAGGTNSSESGAKAAEPTPDNPVKMRIAYIPGFASMQMRIAADKGFFKKHGIDAVLTEGATQQAWVAGLGRQYEIAQAAPAVLLAAVDKGADVVAVAGVGEETQEVPGQVVVSKKPLKSWKDLEGKKLGAPTLGGQSDVAVQYMVEQDGGDRKKVKIIQMPYPTMPDQLKAGNVDAVTSTNGFWEQLKKQGYSVSEDAAVSAVQAASGGSVDRAQQVLQLADRKWAEENPGALKAYRAALQEAIDWIEGNEKDARAFAVKWLGLSEDVANEATLPIFTVDFTAEELAPYIKITEWYGSIKPGLKAEDLVIEG